MNHSLGLVVVVIVVAAPAIENSAGAGFEDALAPTTQDTMGGATAPTTIGARDFPSGWFGTWRGPCTYTPAKGAVKSFEMELTVERTDEPSRFKWEIVYVEDGRRQVRPYELLVVDATAGRYVIDERNSIRIDSTFIDGALYSQFDVMAARVTATYRVDGERMLVELITTDTKRPVSTGGEGQVPPVTAYPARGVQRATLQRAP